MKKARQLQLAVVALTLGFGSGNEIRTASSPILQAQGDTAQVFTHQAGELGVAWSTGSGGKGWSDMFM
ncbi:hypothetical protein [uncultured Dechloromonas sp.]|uniref:hypothetical protein n=1 Tax=uncultured Dechloromonas sp. TaxID=171719 RepID=UPI0025E29EEC|nr:hypothetical protein [uncultured Dechloromonas sp.]